MSQYDNTNTGVLFINDKGDNPKRPDRKGSINIDGVDYWLSGWISDKDDKDGNKFLKLKVERKEKQQDARNQAKANGYQPERKASPGMPPAPEQTEDDGDDSIPF